MTFIKNFESDKKKYSVTGMKKERDRQVPWWAFYRTRTDKDMTQVGQGAISIKYRSETS